MKYAAEIGTGVMICIPSFMNIGSGVQKFTGEDSQRAG
jgi:tetrahydrodipicolinate N-succinyltransferase